MRRKTMMIMLIAGITAGTMVVPACVQASVSEQTKEQNESKYDPADYVKLGDCKDIRIEIEPKRKITDEDVEKEIRYRLMARGIYSKTNRKTAERGDLVSIDFKGTIGGKEFDGGSGEGVRIRLGSGALPKELEDALIGQDVDKTVFVSATLPENFRNQDAAGKKAEFEAVIVSIDDEGILTDENAVVLSEGKASSADECRKQVRKELEENEESARNSFLLEIAKNRFIGISKIKGYPEDEVRRRTDEAMRESAGRESSEDENEELRNIIEDGVRRELAEEMILETFAKKEGISATDEEIDAEIKKHEAYTEYEKISKHDREFYKKEVIKNNAVKKILELVEIVETEDPDEDYGFEYPDFESDE